MSRFSHDLSLYDLKLVYEPGPSNYVPDAVEAFYNEDYNTINSDNPVNLARGDPYNRAWSLRGSD